MVLLTQLPPEILHHVLSYVAPEDLARLAYVCRDIYYFVTANSALHQAIYLNSLDDPPTRDLNWVQELQDLVKLKRICASKDPDKESHLGFVHDTVTRLLKHAAHSGARSFPSLTYPRSRNAQLLTEAFDRLDNRHAFFCNSTLFERARGSFKSIYHRPLARKLTPEARQQSAKLHCLYGMAVLSHGRTRSSRMYPFACSKVYDMREYTPLTRWGPFADDGTDSVDWEKVEAILIVLRANIRSKGLDNFPIFTNFWNTPFPGSWPNSYLPLPLVREISALDAQDPYDVAGTWLRVVCFLDYNDFFNYNFPGSDEPPPDVPRPALDVGEATRLILMKIHVTRIEAPEPDDGQELPVVYFEGFSRSLDGSWDENANSDLRGTARLTREGEVRWTTFSIFGGQERWRSEGIQLGGIRSTTVVGNWFDKDYDPAGPCGPTAFWKISDREPKSDDKQVLLNDFLPIVDGYEDEFDDDNGDGDEDVLPQYLDFEFFQVGD
ncbi:F-box domain-containing protein [Pleurostoma richardsiae]|uniref:F-box domain-containing protein n=1 Tax=Pleurostoma richardsiae TaxID=41990 RepID=A0AA38S4A8_9PEZI|nr:F-box domain-containing protein [Pleurostoma richardsiae]